MGKKKKQTVILIRVDEDKITDVFGFIENELMNKKIKTAMWEYMGVEPTVLDVVQTVLSHSVESER